MPRDMCGFKEGEAVDPLTLISLLMTHCERLEDELKEMNEKKDASLKKQIANKFSELVEKAFDQCNRF